MCGSVFSFWEAGVGEVVFLDLSLAFLQTHFSHTALFAVPANTGALSQEALHTKVHCSQPDVQSGMSVSFSNDKLILPVQTKFLCIPKMTATFGALSICHCNL